MCLYYLGAITEIFYVVGRPNTNIPKLTSKRVNSADKYQTAPALGLHHSLSQRSRGSKIVHAALHTQPAYSKYTGEYHIFDGNDLNEITESVYLCVFVSPPPHNKLVGAESPGLILIW